MTGLHDRDHTVPPFAHRVLQIAFVCVCATLVVSQAHAEIVKVTDIRGRSFELEVPAKRVVLGLYFEDYWAIGGDAAMDRLVGISKAAWRDWRPANWAAYLKVRPSLDDIADIGEIEVGTFSVEKLIALRPSVAILAEWQVNGIGSDFERILDAGIPVVIVDYHAQTRERHVASTRLIGTVTGAEQRADRIVREYEAALQEIQARIDAAGQPHPSIYVELGIKGPGEQGPSYGDYMWGKLAGVAGGDNISRDRVNTWGPIAPEHVLAARPEVIVISGSEWRQHPTALLMGEGVIGDEARQRLRGFVDRPGWSALPAVQNGRVHGVYQGNSRTIMDYTALQYLAKALYPRLFADLDPQANYRAFYLRHLPIRPNGTFMISVE